MIPSESVASAFHTVQNLVSYYVPGASLWSFSAGAAALLGLGAMVAWVGARLAPLLVALTAAAIGAACGASVAVLAGLDGRLGAVIGGASFGLAGLCLFRIWLGLFLATCLALGCTSVYYVRTLTPHVASYTSRGLGDGMVTLPVRGAPGAAEAPSLSGLRDHIARHVPSVGRDLSLMTLAAVVVAIALVALAPWTARALAAATLGTVMLLTGAIPLVDSFAPGAADQLARTGPWGWTLVAALWLGVFGWNLRARPRTDRSKAQAAPPNTVAARA
jgi:hypothetical protein